MGEIINLMEYKQNKITTKAKQEEDILEEEYQEFIKLLKYFVAIQDSQYQQINIHCSSHKKYVLTDSEGNDITEKVMDEYNVNYGSEIDDVLLSFLIVSAPKDIKIYNRENMDIELQDTLLNIFEDRLSFIS